MWSHATINADIIIALYALFFVCPLYIVFRHYNIFLCVNVSIIVLYIITISVSLDIIQNNMCKKCMCQYLNTKKSDEYQTFQIVLYEERWIPNLPNRSYALFMMYLSCFLSRRNTITISHTGRQFLFSLMKHFEVIKIRSSMK